MSDSDARYSIVSLNAPSSVPKNGLVCQLICFFFFSSPFSSSDRHHIFKIISVIVLLYLCFWTIGNQRRNRLTECKLYEVSPPLGWYFRHIKILSLYLHGNSEASLLFMCHIVTSSLKILGAKWRHTMKSEISVDNINYQSTEPWWRFYHLQSNTNSNYDQILLNVKY